MKKTLYENDNIIVTLTTQGEIDDAWERECVAEKSKQVKYAALVEELISDDSVRCIVLEEGENGDYYHRTYFRDPIAARIIDWESLPGEQTKRLRGLLDEKFPHSLPGDGIPLR